ncbi:MAG: winged helix-turn-helix transcriptional regulator [Candidatus Omnitrophica bacterium]|nr:winged helix-turn-helix transcriptional regulator [Candidatus Omnitrophota bacterium]
MIIDHKKESRILKAMAHPVRLRMVEGLMRHECNVDKIVRALKIPQSTASQHLSVLKSSGIVEMRKEGVKTCYRVLDRKIMAIIDILGKG